MRAHLIHFYPSLRLFNRLENPTSMNPEEYKKSTYFLSSPDSFKSHGFISLLYRSSVGPRLVSTRFQTIRITSACCERRSKKGDEFELMKQIEEMSVLHDEVLFSTLDLFEVK